MKGLSNAANSFVGYLQDEMKVVYVFKNNVQVEGEVIAYRIADQQVRRTVFLTMVIKVGFGQWVIVRGDFADELELRGETTWLKLFNYLKEHGD